MIGTLLEKLFFTVGVDLSDLKSGMRDALREVSRYSDALRKDFAEIGKGWKATGEGMMKAGAVMSGAITAPLALFGKHAAQAAIDAGEMQSAFDVVFGSMAGDVRKWAEETGNALGRSTQEMQRGALAFQELFGKALEPAKAAEMSKQFAVLTQDLASFKNLSNEVAQQKLFSGLTGEAEPLRAVGVFLSEAAVEAKGLALGLATTGKALTDQDKIVARAALIREQLSQADGDVARTADSTANRIRAAQSAYEELSITVGETLIPALTPLIGAISSALLAFNALDPEMQKMIVAGAGIAAALGPVITVVGGIITGIGALMPAIGAAIPIVSGLGTGFLAVAYVLAPLAPILAAVAAAGYLIYENWDKIAPVLSDFWQAASTALGPPIKALVEALSGALVALWQGPLGEGIRSAISALGSVWEAFNSTMGPALVGLIKIMADTLLGVFQKIGAAISVVAALLRGDWAGAWSAALEFVNRALGGIPAIAANMVGQLREWLVGKLGEIWATVTQKIDIVKNAFFDLYDAVVGHSYIPDMVDEIGQNMARLQGLMVDPATRATNSTKEAFRSLASDVAGVLDRLFPLQAQIRSILDDMATLDKAKAAGQISAATYGAAMGELEKQKRGAENEANPITLLPEQVEPITIAMDELSTVLMEIPHVASDAEIALGRIGERLGDSIMGGLRDVLTGKSSLKDVARRLLSDFFNDTITSALKSLEKSIFGEGGLGGFLGSLFSSVISGRAVGGPVVPGSVYTVGTGEKFVPSTTGRILSRTDAMAAAGGGGDRLIRVVVDKSDYFDARVEEISKSSANKVVATYDRGVGSRVTANMKRRG